VEVNMGVAVKCPRCGKEVNSDEGYASCPDCGSALPSYEKTQAPGGMALGQLETPTAAYVDPGGLSQEQKDILAKAAADVDAKQAEADAKAKADEEAAAKAEAEAAKKSAKK
jgi:predicted  nucleic acid-binding Zn-ribbon protein